MRILLTLFISYCFPCFLSAQQLTGIWRGYFSSNVSVMGDVARDESYKFEIQMLQENNSLRGVSYSYKTTVFFGKAEFTGVYTPGRKTLILRENKLTDLKISTESEACLMTCYLDYSSIGKMQFLEGTFYAVNIKSKTDCGSGKIHLEKVKESEFKKEDFLLSGNTKKNTAVPPAKNPGSVPLAANAGKTPVKTPGGSNAGSGTGSKVSPPVSNPTQQTAESPSSKSREEESVKSSGGGSSATANNPKNTVSEQPIKKESVPRVLVDRENDLVKTIVTDKQDIRIDLYDNGTIDNDTISVYHNNRLVVRSQRLNFTPISFTIHSEPGETHHEIVVVADNLGDIPPNTALMVVTSGGKERVEIFLASSEKKNAKVVIDYQPKNK